MQGPGYVVIRNEMIHEARVVPLDGRPHSSSTVRSWMGDSRGHWEGNTLVVETTNFLGGDPVGRTPSSDALKVTERFTRTDRDTLEYQATIDDPKTWTKPWTIDIPFKLDNSCRCFTASMPFATKELLHVQRADHPVRAPKRKRQPPK